MRFINFSVKASRIDNKKFRNERVVRIRSSGSFALSDGGLKPTDHKIYRNNAPDFCNATHRKAKSVCFCVVIISCIGGIQTFVGGSVIDLNGIL